MKSFKSTSIPNIEPIEVDFCDVDNGAFILGNNCSSGVNGTSGNEWILRYKSDCLSINFCGFLGALKIFFVFIPSCFVAATSDLLLLLNSPLHCCFGRFKLLQNSGLLKFPNSKAAFPNGDDLFRGLTNLNKSFSDWSIFSFLNWKALELIGEFEI